ncbi:MAG: SLC13 family permease [Cyclobacteriaceae bacterium]|jgi:sodium-dependent dicarboxylate transporter 2/3/5
MRKPDSKSVRLVLALMIPILVLSLPLSIFPDAFTVVQQRVVALFLFAALFWILEPVPIYATSMLIIVLELLLISDSSLMWLRSEAINYGREISHREIMATLASPVIMLFLGGFFLAVAATKYRLDISIAGVLLPRFGRNPKIVLLGLMSMTAFFSMFMSNTATTAMMLSILVPVLGAFAKEDKARVAYVIGIPVAANIGGMGTPIGTPPNAIALKFMVDLPIAFGKWMAFGIPLVLVLLLIAWFSITQLWTIQAKSVELSMPSSVSKSPKALIVYITFVLTILLWITDFLHGMNSYVVALLPVGIFLATGVLNKEDLKLISWDVLWLVSGGIALGLALEQSGLAVTIIDQIPFEDFPASVVLVCACLVGLLMANFMSNTATANLVLPLVAALGTSVSGLGEVGGSAHIILATSLSISLAMSLPISTPPNALAHATGVIQTRDLIKIGLLMGFIGLLLILMLNWILVSTQFLQHS